MDFNQQMAPPMKLKMFKRSAKQTLKHDPNQGVQLKLTCYLQSFL